MAPLAALELLVLSTLYCGMLLPILTCASSICSKHRGCVVLISLGQREHSTTTSLGMNNDQCTARPMLGCNDQPHLRTTTQQGEKIAGLMTISPYWHWIKTKAKHRWQGRTILEVLSTEFRERSSEYYVRTCRAYTTDLAQRLAVCMRIAVRYRIRNGHDKQPGSQLRYYGTLWRSNRVGA